MAKQNAILLQQDINSLPLQYLQTTHVFSDGFVVKKMKKTKKV